jgi:hypothetical protein
MLKEYQPFFVSIYYYKKNLNNKNVYVFIHMKKQTGRGKVEKEAKVGTTKVKRDMWQPTQTLQLKHKIMAEVYLLLNSNYSKHLTLMRLSSLQRVCART